jgi:alpha-L-glutamate ligase-like protein/uncharacterized protein (TIGR02421 family)
MSLRNKSKEILGINARNLLYISRYNSRANKKFADDKIYTKNYLQSRNINVARLYQVIRSHTELNNFKPGSLPGSFVIKPNRGYGGEGIIVISGKKKNKYIGIDHSRYLWTDLYRHCESILAGKYSISGLSDQIIFEELLQRHEYFNKFTSIGLPDVRIIVFNLVPVMAMLRLPTEESGGKANIHLGGIGFGIDMNSGKANYGVTQKGIYHNKFIRKLPNGEPVSSLVVPEWDEVLFTAAKAQAASQIGYLAVDIALTTTGVKVLELNARAGLSVQIANLAPLKARLEKVADLKVTTPEQGVEVSKTLFTQTGKAVKPEEADKASPKPIIGLYEEVEILNTKFKSVRAKIDPHAKENVIDHSLDINSKWKYLEIKLADQRITLPITRRKFKDANYKIILAGKYLTDFLIDANLDKGQKRKKQSASAKAMADKDEKIIQNVDKKICQIDEMVHLLSYFRPINLDQEKAAFFEYENYNPKFIYRRLAIDIKKLKQELKKIPVKFDHPLTPLFKKKIKEVGYKLSILESRDTPQLQTNSEKLYGQVDQQLYNEAVEYIKKNPIIKDDSKKLSFKASLKQLEKFLKDNKLHGWKIKIVEGVNSDMQVNKTGTIFVKKGATFSANRLMSLIAHEVQTHIFRLENGRQQKYKIFERGTADYLTTEEGLSIYNQNVLGLNLGSKHIWPALNVIAVFKGKELGFCDLYHYLLENYFIEPKVAWQVCTKVKRGYNDTAQHLIFAKDHIYFKGYMMINKFIKAHGKEKLKNLYIGKISINDLRYIKDIDNYPVKFLPKFD